MKFEFAKYTEVTDLAFKINAQYQEGGYIRVFICPDVNDTWIVRILEGYNEEFEQEEGSYILERDKVLNDYKGQKITMLRLKTILEEDSFENWDIKQSYNVEELVDMLDYGFGILNRK